MADLIDRQQALALRFTKAINEDGVVYVPLGEYLSGIESLPPAQTERKKGRWIRKTDTRFGEMLNDILICSECGIAFPTLNMIRRSYCPSCGARMER